MNDQGIHLICSSWGVKYAKRLSGDLGWDDENILSRASHSAGRCTPGHSILCGQMSPDEERVERGFNKLSEKLRKAMLVKYVMPNLSDRSDGRDWRNSDLARVLDIPISTFLKRVDTAKKIIKKGEFRG